MGIPKRQNVITPDEYLRLERAAEYRSEYFAGEIFAMAGGSFRQSLIKTNVSRELSLALKGHTCVACDSDLRIKVNASGLYSYPDASVICEPIEFDDEIRDTVLNPILLVEVLSPSTEAYDRGKKFEHYRRIPSLREYLLVSQESPLIEHYLRTEDKKWMMTEVSGLDATLVLPSLGIELTLREIFDRVDFNFSKSE